MRTQTESIARRAAKDITKGYDIKVRIEMAIEQALAQRTWVGLTLDEIALLHANYPNPQGFALALQAKLKERNT